MNVRSSSFYAKSFVVQLAPPNFSNRNIQDSNHLSPLLKVITIAL